MWIHPGHLLNIGGKVKKGGGARGWLGYLRKGGPAISFEFKLSKNKKGILGSPPRYHNGLCLRPSDNGAGHGPCLRPSNNGAEPISEGPTTIGNNKSWPCLTGNHDPMVGVSGFSKASVVWGKLGGKSSVETD